MVAEDFRDIIQNLVYVLALDGRDATVRAHETMPTYPDVGEAAIVCAISGTPPSPNLADMSLFSLLCKLNNSQVISKTKLIRQAGTEKVGLAEHEALGEIVSGNAAAIDNRPQGRRNGVTCYAGSYSARRSGPAG